MQPSIYFRNKFVSPLAACSLLVGGVVLSGACSTSNSTTPSDGGIAADAGPSGGPVSGAQDSHCGTKVQETSSAGCHPDAGPPMDAGGGDGGMDEPFGDTLFNSEGDDDDCKYHVKWSANGIYQNTDVTFTVVATNKSDSSPLHGSPVSAEVFLDDTHPAPNSNQKANEGASGTYTVGPIRFDASGKWTLRFHFHEECEDLTEDSPHGHIAFFVNVP